MTAADPAMDVAITREHLINALRESLLEKEQLYTEHAQAEARLSDHFKSQQVIFKMIFFNKIKI